MSTTLPAFRAYAIRKSKDDSKKDFRTAIGAAWPSRDHDGFDIILDALPINGRIVLIPNELPEQRDQDKPTGRSSYARQDRRDDSRSDAKARWKRQRA